MTDCRCIGERHWWTIPEGRISPELGQRCECGEAPFEFDVQTETERKTRIRTPKDDLWDSLASHFGEPRTKTERSRFGKVVGELLEAGATPEETDNACLYVLRNFDSPSVFAVTAWFSVSQKAQTKPTGAAAAIEQLRRVQ